MPRLTGMLPLDISPDHSEMMLGQIPKGSIYQGTTDGPFPIWGGCTWRCAAALRGHRRSRSALVFQGRPAFVFERAGVADRP